MFVTVINLIKFVVKLSLYKIWHVSRLFHLSFDLGVQSPYPCQCGMGGYPVVGNQCVTNMSNLNFSHF